MWSISDLLLNFFTHRDFLPAADRLSGTLFTPMHFLFAGILLILTGLFCILFSGKREKTLRTVFAVLWAVVTALEIVKIIWETCAGKTVDFNWSGILPLYPCSIFMYAMPFAIWGKGRVRRAACGYVCTLGLLGGAINFIYPVNVLSHYSCLSFAGLHTLLYHGVLVFCAILMLLSRYHTYTGVTNARELLLPAVPFLIVSVFANLVNFSPVGSDYMFFKLRSFFFAPIDEALPTAVCVVLVYGVYLLIHALPYLPSYFANKRKEN